MWVVVSKLHALFSVMFFFLQMGLLLLWKRPHFVAIGCWRKLFLHHLFDEFLCNKGLIPAEGIMLPSPCECVPLHSQKNRSADLQLMTESLSSQFSCT
jgi:hypothetical protein